MAENVEKIISIQLRANEAINGLKVIEVVVRKNILELLNLDFTKPIYINQLATTFVIDNIATDNGEQYKLTLVRI